MTQTEHILHHLMEQGSITPIDALRDYGCFRLAARIGELRKQGFSIETVLDNDNGKQFARYKLKRSPK